MRIIIDLQSLQTDSANRGIGRYVGALTHALIDKLIGEDIYILVNDCGHAARGTEILRSIQEKIGAGRSICFPFISMEQVSEGLGSPGIRLSEKLRERFIEAYSPDVVLVASLFEMHAASTIPPAGQRSYLCATILYDLIPLTDPSNHLPSADARLWYEGRLTQLKNADIIFSISDYVRCDALKRLGLPKHLIENISAGVRFDGRQSRSTDTAGSAHRQAMDLQSYILYVGAFEKRKNLEGLILAYASLPRRLQESYRLVFVGRIDQSRKVEIVTYAEQEGVSKRQMNFEGFVDESALLEFYRNARLFVFPSFEEGFGLPPLEAMTLGTPTIASNVASLPEVVGNTAALFNPHDLDDFSEKLRMGLEDEAYRAELIEKGLERSKLFSWQRSVDRVVGIVNQRIADVCLGSAKSYLSFRDFVKDAHDEIRFDPRDKRSEAVIGGLLTKALVYATERGGPLLAANELNVAQSFSSSVPDYSMFSQPYAFSSTLCRQQHFHLPLYTFWCGSIGLVPKYHRRQWGWVYVCQVLHERGYLVEGRSGLGFVEKNNPLATYFKSRGVDVSVSSDFSCIDLAGQSSEPLKACDFNFCWSSVDFFALGSVQAGTDFVVKSAKALMPGGLAVHVIEYDIGMRARAVSKVSAFQGFGYREVARLVDELVSEGFVVEPVDLTPGDDALERYIDFPSHIDEPHLRSRTARACLTTSLGLIVRAPG